MLKGIPGVINPELLKALAEMGHGDILVIGDDFYPAASTGKNGIVINADGISAVDMLQGVLTLMPLDTICEKYPVSFMRSSLENAGRPLIWDDFIDVIEQNGLNVNYIDYIDRKSFYEKAKNAYVTISTGEQRPFGCLILQKGVK